MKREDAIWILELIRNRDARTDAEKDAVNAAIEALKAQLSKEGTTFDTISRQATIDAIVQCTNCGDEDTLREYVLKHSLDNGWTGGILEALDAVKDLPSVQPEPHEGRFERKRDGVFCSVCHYGWEFITGVPAEVEREYHYCPNCGADMRGEQDG